MSALNWLSEFLNKRNCPDGKPDGRPLFAYRCTIEEFESLKDLLISAEKNLPGSNYHLGYALSTGYLFALYCSEWWRRHYSGGVWKWAPIIASLGWDHNTWSTRTEFVVKGLRYWKRDLIHTGAGTQYLLSVASEGGIPINVLQREGASFKHYLKAVIRDYGHYVSSGLEAERIALDNLYRLPSSWQQDQIATLAGQIIEQVWRLKSEIGESKDPVKTLNDVHPGWDTELPIELESEQAETLINSLLTAARDVASRDRQVLRVERYLDHRSDSWYLTARLLLPKELSVGQIMAMGTVNSAFEIPDRMEMYRVIGDERILVAKLSGDGDTRFVRPVPGAAHPYAEGVEKEVSIILVARGQDITSLSVAGGSELDSELPWSFIMTDDDMKHFRWVAQGGCQRQEADIFVLSTQIPKILANNDSAGIEQIEGDLLARKFWWITKPVELSADQDDEIYRIEPGLENIAERDYRLIGHRRYFPQTRFPLYHSVPNIQLVNDDSTYPVPHDEIFWRPIGTRKWRSYNKLEMIGEMEIRHRQDRVAFASWKLAIIPEGAELRVKPNSRLEGTIIIICPNARAAAVKSATGLDVHTNQLENSWEFLCKRYDVTVGNIYGELSWPAERKLSFSIPFPAEGASFVDSEGREKSISELLTLTRLYGIRAQVVSPNINKKYVLRGSLSTSSSLTALEFHKFEFSMGVDEYGISTLPLQQLKSDIDLLFAVSTGVDDQVKLELIEEARGSVEASVMIQQFEGMLYTDQTRRMISLAVNNNELNEEYAGSSLTLVSINGLDEEPLSLEWNEVSFGWTLPDYNADEIDISHTYFASIDSERSHNIRPCLLLPETNSDDVLSQLAKAMTMSEEAERRELIAQHLSYISREGTDDDWDELYAYLKRLSGVHPDGLDLVECMLDFPDILASVWFRAVPDQGLRDYLQKICDTSPFAWWMISIEQWLSARKRWLESLNEFSDSVRTILIEECKKLLVNLSDDNEEMNTVVDVLLECFGENLSENSVITGVRKTSSPQLEWRKLDAMSRGFYIPGIDGWWPKIADVFTLRRELPEDIFNSILWPTDDMNYQKPVIQAPVIAAAALHADIEINENMRVALLAARNFHPSAFATLFRATQAILWVNQENN